MELALKRPARFSPRNPRCGVDIAASLVLANDVVVPIRIENLSSHGFMGTGAFSLDRGIWLGVELPGHGIVRARVRWSGDGEAGFEFRAPLDIERYSIPGQRMGPGLFGAGHARAPLPQQP